MDAHSQAIINQYKENLPNYIKINEIVLESLKGAINSRIHVDNIESRVKTESSLIGKLELKGYKYNDIYDLTDIVGARIITFYKYDVDKIASIIDKLFDVDWVNSVDKRKANAPDTFGYMSLHYICTIPKSMYYDVNHPEINKIRFEIQMRTCLQHVWATAAHDTGYKSDIEIPSEQIRKLYRLSSLLEIADDEFSNTISDINSYRRKANSLIKKGSFDDVELDINTYRSYLELKPFSRLTTQIAEVNTAEIESCSEMPYYFVLVKLGIKNLGQIEKMKNMYSDYAFKAAASKLTLADLDIISSTVGIFYLCIVYAVKTGLGCDGIKMIYDTLYGPKESHNSRANSVYEQLRGLGINEEF